VPPTPHRDTAVVDTPWDGGAAESKLSNDAGQATYEQVYAWRNPDGDPDTKGAYSLPHHEVSSDGKPGPANVAGVRNALSRLPQVKGMPDGDQATVRANLQKHLDKFNRQNGDNSSADEFIRSRVETIDEESFVTLRYALDVPIAGKVWAIDSEERLRTLLALDGRSLSAAIVARGLAATPPSSVGGNSVAVVPLQGVLMPPMGGLLGMLFGGGGLQSFQGKLASAAANPDVGVIVMDIDSPGGLVDQIPETAAQMRAVRAQKPIVAVANTQADSAAYWLASQADEVVVTPSGDVGSIGVYNVHKDLSEAHAMRGIQPTIISAGKYKVEGNPYQALDPTAQAAIQADVDDYYGMFTADVAKGRGVAQSDVQSGFGEGRSLHAKQAVRAGLADRVDTLENTVRRVSNPTGRRALMDKRTGDEAHDVDHWDAIERLQREVAPAYTAEDRNRLLAVLAD
jgi:signal peptide peptidase SppA